MPSIGTWLEELGLEKYLGAFEAAEVDYETLPELVEADLKEMALPLGPRRKILASIRDMQSTLSEANAAVPALSHGHTTDLARHAERRHLTIMFVDLVGSTQISMRLDAEDMRDVISQYHNAVSRVVSGYNGFVASLMGDGVMCYFGWPNANEDDTERAVRAGLAAIEATREITTPDGAPLAARVGVATGVVVVGDMIGIGARQEAAVVGETPNLAARLQGVARPNQLVIPGEVRSLLSKAFKLMPLGHRTLKGVGRPVEAFVVEREAAVESRFAARRSGSLIPLVGREAEMKKISDFWAQARDGQGQMVLLEGEAGIGKSRVVRAAIDDIAADNHIRLTYQCSPYHSESAFYPFIQQMNYAAGLTARDSSELRLKKLETAVNGSAEMNAQMAILLGIDGAERYGVPKAPPTQQRGQLMQALVEFLIGKAAEKPLLVVIEDLHWIDPTSLELIELLLETVGDHRILVVATTRPTLEHEFDAHPALCTIGLGRLGRTKTYAIVGKLTGGKTLPDGIMKIIARQTDGVPLFVEELTKAILESGALREDRGGYVLTRELTDIAIPATLHDSLMARLDRLGPIKEIAQIAACVGREFDHRLLPQICDIPGAKLDEALNALVDAGMIHRRGNPPQARYQFKHALVRDAAYESLLKERRRPFHRRILSALENEPGISPELLAAHAGAGALTERAIALWKTAGASAMARPAYREAESHLRRAIALNAPQVALKNADALSRALSLQVQLANALTPAKGLWSDEVVATLERALELADQVGETPLRGDIIYQLLLGTYFRGSLKLSVARADELEGIAIASGDIAQLMLAKRLAAIGRLNQGLFAQAQSHLDDAEALCDQLANQDLKTRFGHDPVVAVKIYQAMNATFRGQSARAARYSAEAEARAEKIEHINTTCTMLGIAIVNAQLAGDLDVETRHLGVLRALTQEHDVAASRMGADLAAGLHQLARGDAGGLETYREAEKPILDANIRLLVPGHRTLAARRVMQLGLQDEARQMADAAEEMMQDTGEKSWLPDVYRLRAAFALSEGDIDAAEAFLTSALAVSERDGATLWGLRAATDLASLYVQTGRDTEAYNILVPAARLIKPGDCPVEIAMAQGVLGSLDRAVS